MAEVIAVLFVVLVMPLAIIMHYVTKWKETKGLSTEDERMLQELWDDAQRMQTRINALETILDNQVPEWRKRV
jgi:phage shock protein B